MSMIRGSVGPGAGGALVPILNSLRFRAGASAYLSRTFGVPTDAKKWTMSVWVKKSAISSGGGSPSFWGLFGVDTTTAGCCFCNLTNWPITGAVADNPVYADSVTDVVWTSQRRDPGAWYHILYVYDTTQAVSTDRVKLYINGVLQTYSTSLGLPALNASSPNINASGLVHTIGRGASTGYFDHTNTQFCFVDGQALTPSSFAATDSTSGEWKPLTAAQIRTNVGTWGNNGCMLLFNGTPGATIYDRKVSDTDTTGNNWTATNISTTPGTTYDWLIDSPTNAASGTQPVGNYCTLNPLTTALDLLGVATLSNANLSSQTASDSFLTAANGMFMSAGKYYAECTVDSIGGTTGYIGVGSATNANSTASGTGAYQYKSNGEKDSSASAPAAYGATYTTGDVIGVAYDATNGTLEFTKNGVSQGVAFTGISLEPRMFCCFNIGAATWNVSWNFGQRPFAYTPPTGFQALCSANLPTPAVPKGSVHVQAKLDTGANIKATCEAVYTYLYEVIKDRANANNWQSLNTVRGLGANALQWNTTSPGAAYSAPAGNSLGLVFNLAGAAVSNTVGSITTSVAANPTAGIAVLTYTGTGANATLGHGLGFAPTAEDGYMAIFKDTTAASANNHVVMHSGLTSAAYYILLNSTAAQVNDATMFNSTAPTSTVLSIGTNANVNTAGHTYEVTLFFGVKGFSKFCSYVMNANSANGPFIYSGGKPTICLWKDRGAVVNWELCDAVRGPYNVDALRLYPNLTNAEDTFTTGNDLVSNGVKMRHASSGGNGVLNNIGIAAIFNSAPFNYSNAR